nr:MAG: ORF1 [TTV-like mini virus]
MPYYKRYWNKYPYQRRKWRRRRLQYRRRRPKQTFRRRRNYFRKVKRTFFKRFRLKKLKKLNLKQWQPRYIRKCHIKGYLQLFGGGVEKMSYNFAMYKDSYVPEYEPGGGGWSIQQLTLSNLYTQNKYLQNWWTVSNKGLNMCRYLRLKILLYRQKETDYIFNYRTEPPYDVSKYYYASMHPYKMLLFNQRIVVPSFATQPLNKKKYIKKYIEPPREIKNQWYFQQHFSKLPLLEFSVTACSLNSMYIPTNAISNNITVHSLNTNFFQNPRFQYAGSITTGYLPKRTGGPYIYGVPQAEPLTNWKNLTIKDNVVYLGDTMNNDPGHPISTTNMDNYTATYWGNPLYFRYLDGSYLSFISNTPVSSLKQLVTENKKILDMKPLEKTDPYIYKCRYNPWKDLGEENLAYWVSNLNADNWDPPKDPDLIIGKFPLWILLWGWSDFTEKIKKITIKSGNYMLVIRTSSLDQKLPAYVLLSHSFINGRAPYDRDAEEISTRDWGHWYPRWKFQQEEIEHILTTGPAVCKSEKQKSVQAHMHYDFLFKWGGNPSKMENINDPMSQPIYPLPDHQLFQNEITNPTTSIKNMLYDFDIRRDMLTKTAEKRIKEITTDDESLFSDGDQPTTDPPIPFKKAPPEETTSEKEKAETLLLQLNTIQHHNRQLKHRLQQLMLLTKDT